MTYEEALNFNQKWTEEQAFNDLERYLLREELPAMKAVAICMRATEKQIPKKLIATRCRLKCPSCNHIITDKNCTKTSIKFCWVCGQALDWSKEE